MIIYAIWKHSIWKSSHFTLEVLWKHWNHLTSANISQYHLAWFYSKLTFSRFTEYWKLKRNFGRQLQSWSISAPFLTLIIHRKTFNSSTKPIWALPSSPKMTTHQIVKKNIWWQTGQHYKRGSAAVLKLD